jgi:hypothetical protein
MSIQSELMGVVRGAASSSEGANPKRFIDSLTPIVKVIPALAGKKVLQTDVQKILMARRHMSIWAKGLESVREKKTNLLTFPKSQHDCLNAYLEAKKLRAKERKRTSQHTKPWEDAPTEQTKAKTEPPAPPPQGVMETLDSPAPPPPPETGPFPFYCVAVSYKLFFEQVLKAESLDEAKGIAKAALSMGGHC